MNSTGQALAYDLPPPVLSAIIGALAALLVLFIKESMDRTKATKFAALTMIWLAKSVRHGIAIDPAALPHLDLGILKSCASEVARSERLSAASFLLQEVFCDWRNGVYLHREHGSLPVVEAYKKLDKVLQLCT